MSHGDAVTAAPDGFDVVASSAGAPVAAFENRARRLAGVQYHPEVMHTPHGQQVLSRFLHDFAGIGADVDGRQHRRRAGRAGARPDR